MEPQSPPTYTPTPAPQPKRWPAVLVAAAVALVLGAAVGWIVPGILDDDDDDVVTADPTDTTAPIETTVPTETTAPASVETTIATDTLPAGTTLWGHHGGSFQVALPTGWETRSSYYDMLTTPTVSALADPDSEDGYYAAGGIAVTHYAVAGQTPDSVLDGLTPSSRCPTIVGREDYTHGAFSGTVEKATGCANGYELWRIAVPLEDGSILLVDGAVLNGDQTTLTNALDTFSIGAKESAQLLEFTDCTDLEPTDDPAFPNTFKFINYSGGDITYGYVDPATGEKTENEPVPSGFNNYRFTKEGDTFRFDLAGGPVDYVATGDLEQCALITPDGLQVVENAGG